MTRGCRFGAHWCKGPFARSSLQTCTSCVGFAEERKRERHATKATHLTVFCPVCRAPVGEPCKRPDGSRPILPHTARRRLSPTGRSPSAPDCRCAGPLYNRDTPCPVHPKVGSR